MRAPLLLAIGFLIVTTPRGLGACSCVADIPLCESFWAADAVFEGEVTAVESLRPSKGAAHMFSSRRVQFTVTRVWRGEVTGTVAVLTGSGGGDCGYNFREGRKYLVFAAEHEGRMTTNICSPTRPLESAAQELAYLTSAVASTAGGRIFGVVRASDDRPVSGYTVTLRGGDRQRTAVTNSAGEFEFTGMPQGDYTIGVVVHDGERAYGREDVNLRDARACAKRDFGIETPRPPVPE